MNWWILIVSGRKNECIGYGDIYVDDWFMDR